MKRTQCVTAPLRLLAWSLVLAALPASACSVPVFRYALEHWTADRYGVSVVYDRQVPAELVRLLDRNQDIGLLSNHKLKRVDLSETPMPGIVNAAQVAATPNRSFLVVHSPQMSAVPSVVWSGPLDDASWKAAFHSPSRQTIAERLGSGESAVWVLLESGDHAADDAAASLLQARLDYLATVLALPKLDEQDIRNGLVSLPPDGLRLAFSVVRVSRDDPAEQIFIQMLLASEPDLKQSRETMAFPIFGQGRALYALVGKGIRHETIDEAASFLIGSCSCQVKERNPGTDLLMAVDWKQLIRDQASELEDLPSAKDIAGTLPVAVTISAKPSEDIKTGPASWLKWMPGALAVVLGTALVRRLRGGS